MFGRALLILGFVLTLAESGLATDYYATPSGAGLQNGTSWANAFPQSRIDGTPSVVDSVMVAGDVLHLGSGTYSQPINLDSSGAASSLKKIIGEDTGGGLPILDMGNWSRDDPSNTAGNKWSAIGFRNAASHWSIENLFIQDVVYAVRPGGTFTGQHVGIVLRNLTIRNCEHALYIYDAKDWLIEGVLAKEYTKQGFRFDHNCANIVMRDCTADLSGGDPAWYADAEIYPFGFVVETPGTNEVPNSNITFEDCLAQHNRLNGQSGYWNGDGFVVNQGNMGFFNFIRCRALDNEDGGFDIKPPIRTDAVPSVTMIDCVAFQNKRNFRFHSGRASMTNCVAGYPITRDGHSRAGVWVSGANLTIDFSTMHGSSGSQLYGVLQEDGSGQATVKNSIISFEASTGEPDEGNVTLESTTAVYAQGSGTNPQYVNPHPGWDGTGEDLNSNTYGTSKGYFQNPGSEDADHRIVPTNIAPTIDGSVDSRWNSANSQTIANIIAGPVVDAGDLSGSFRTLWDSTNLYVLVEVSDQAQQNDSGVSTWHDDSVEIYIDADNDKQTSYGSDDYQYRFTWNGSLLIVQEIKHGATIGVTASRAQTAAGYAIEVKLPWNTLNQSSVAFGALLGFDVHINDDDDGGSRDSKKAWFNTADTSWQNPGTFATAMLQADHEVVQAAIAPSVDGNVEASWNSANSETIANVVLGPVTSDINLSGSFRTLWDSSNLYVLVQINDDAQHNDSGTQPWNDDSVEIYIDANNDKQTSYGSDDYRYNFVWNGSSVTIRELQHNAVTGVVASRVSTATGYTIEVKLPWSTLGQTGVAVNALFGLDVHINDDDNGGSREGKKAWFNTVDTSWQNPGTFATVRLIGVD